MAEICHHVYPLFGKCNSFNDLLSTRNSGGVETYESSRLALDDQYHFWPAEVQGHQSIYLVQQFLFCKVHI